MPKATFKLTNGTTVTIDGTPQEIKELLSYYETKEGGGAQKGKPKIAQTLKPESGSEKQQAETTFDLMDIVNKVKECDEAEAIEREILDKSSQVNRTLLPFYIVHKYMNNAFRLTSGDISKITKELGVPILGPNASKTLTVSAKRYVIADAPKKKGRPIKYRLSRPGVKYMKGIIGMDDK
jgi:hypothetical protein